MFGVDHYSLKGSPNEKKCNFSYLVVKVSYFSHLVVKVSSFSYLVVKVSFFVVSLMVIPYAGPFDQPPIGFLEVSFPLVGGLEPDGLEVWGT